MSDLRWIQPGSTEFPPSSQALREPNGLLAVGGDLGSDQLLAAYRRGIFPWYDSSQPVLWWTPDPRLVLFPEHLHLSRSLRKLMRRAPFQATTDRAFDRVISLCAEPRGQQGGTWITADIAAAYRRLHHLGYAHSVEVWQGGELAGGLYGVALGRVFFGESMFSRVSNASKYGFVRLVQYLREQGFRLIDCQVHTTHLASFGAEEIPRRQFEQFLIDYQVDEAAPPSWPTELEPIKGE